MLRKERNTGRKVPAHGSSSQNDRFIRINAFPRECRAVLARAPFYFFYQPEKISNPMNSNCCVHIRSFENDSDGQSYSGIYSKLKYGVVSCRELEISQGKSGEYFLRCGFPELFRLRS